MSIDATRNGELGLGDFSQQGLVFSVERGNLFAIQGSANTA